jgi:DNA repair exonuclease SbcCD ATPase subunit
MTKDFQKELKEKVKEGVKPSDLKKLKRSKSAGDVANIPLPPKEPDNKYPYTQLVSQAQEIDELKKETKAKSETIEALEKSPPYPLLAEQLKEKQKEIETLREQLETAHTTKSQFQQELQNELSELDQSLISRGKLLRD